MLDDPYEYPARSAELADSVSMAAKVLLERLSPAERAVVVLHEVFGFSVRTAVISPPSLGRYLVLLSSSTPRYYLVLVSNTE